MSVGSFFKGFLHVLSGASAATAPFQGFISMIPIVGGPIVTILKAMNLAEELLTNTGDGPQRKAMALEIINRVHPGLDQAKLGSRIDAIVTGIKMIEDQLADLAPPKP